ncbi:MAG: hypothetical protein FD179_1786 [Erysipelotrichaceae bacterium]|nr:MAG: hypothetical protein FD179_1786 [Erysipelotrichaceae bacterium]
MAACGKKEEPKPDNFLPLDINSTIVSIVDHTHPELSSTKTSVAYIRDSLQASKWTLTEGLSVTDGTLTFTVSDHNDVIYDFYDGIKDFVIVKRKDKSTLVYTFSIPILTLIGDYLNKLANYNPGDAYSPFKYEFATLTDNGIPGAVLPLRIIQGLRTKITTSLFKTIDLIDPSSGSLRYSITNIMGDRLDFYSAEKPFMIVIRADQTTKSYLIDTYSLDNINNYLAVYLNNPVFDEKRTYQYYLGDLESFSESKLTAVLEEQNSAIQKSLFYMTFYPVNEMIEVEKTRNGPIRLILKDDQGTYVTLYQDLYTAPGMDSSMLVSIGKTPGGTDNTFYTVDYLSFGDYTLITQVAYPAISGPAELDLSKYTFTHVDILQNLSMNVFVFETISKAYDSRFKAIIDRYATLDWKLVTDIDESVTYTALKLKTTTKAMIYLSQGKDIYLVLDEDPLAPGAIYYKAISNEFWIYNWIRAFNFAAQIPLKEAPIVGKVTGVNDYDPAYTGENGEEVKTLDLTPSQSKTITSLLKPETWTETNYGDWEYYYFNEVLSLKTDDGKTYVFDVFTTEYDLSYVRFFIYGPWNSSWNSCFMPYEVYADLLKAVEAIR